MRDIERKRKGREREEREGKRRVREWEKEIEGRREIMVVKLDFGYFKFFFELLIVVNFY